MVFMYGDKSIMYQSDEGLVIEESRRITKSNTVSDHSSFM